jgi:hypothetical protein
LHVHSRSVEFVCWILSWIFTPVERDQKAETRLNDACIMNDKVYERLYITCDNLTLKYKASERFYKVRYDIQTLIRKVWINFCDQ